MVGCYKALAKIGLKNEENNLPMKKAFGFFQKIEFSKRFSKDFRRVVTEYISNEEVDDQFKNDFMVELHHIDGKFNANQKDAELNWLKENTDSNICRVLTNARCLSEGIDVPSLDAIMFLHPRKSQIDGASSRKSDEKV